MIYMLLQSEFQHQEHFVQHLEAIEIIPRHLSLLAEPNEYL